ncbi:MAG TPA: YfiR family protein [Tenuifilaceae bacterium]|nr:YfiR family protein [Tenuifilaceae bacterium]HPE19472.1 YfiR family protein [Tenuifilaceae bacterium]HPJ47003.1 YfiR family protein [Tenuifilaceae bacterium]HPQ35608.1 YfiR family protein [Tenuifilaceae bacterium]HRX68960.1 YfiR family protein [Tenuifilaceae bacterium]
MKTIPFRNSAFKVLTTIFLALLVFTANAQKEKLQTAFVYQLTRLIEWCPEGKTGNFVVGVVGNYPTLVSELTALQVRKVAEQKIEVKSFASLNEVTKCNILFMPDAKKDDLRAANEKIGNACTLIIGDQQGDARVGAGVSIVFLRESSKIQYEISRSFMSTHSLNVNDQLYKLASNIY